MIKSEAITATTTAANKHTVTNGHAGVPRGLTILADKANTDIIYVGGADLTNANGFPLDGADSLSMDLLDGDEIWMKSDANSPTARIIYTFV